MSKLQFPLSVGYFNHCHVHPAVSGLFPLLYKQLTGL